VKRIALRKELRLRPLTSPLPVRVKLDMRRWALPILAVSVILCTFSAPASTLAGRLDSSRVLATRILRAASLEQHERGYRFTGVQHSLVMDPSRSEETDRWRGLLVFGRMTRGREWFQSQCSTKCSSGPRSIRSVRVARTLAIRYGSSPWQCRAVEGSGNVFDPKALTARGRIFLAATRYHHTPVWFIRHSTNGSGDSWANSVWIRRSDYTLLRWTANVVVRGTSGKHSRVDEQFRAAATFWPVGEIRLPITLPRGC
jgi:hypothetical protein